MKCYTVNGKGINGLELIERPDPTIGEYDVLVDVHAVSLNYRDVLVALGKYDPGSHPPFIAASDMSGVVTKVGSKVSLFKAGDKVINAPFRFWPAGKLRREWAHSFIGGAGVDGVLAEKLSYPEHSLVKMPDHLTFAQASTLTIAGLTAWAGLVTHGKLLPGEWVLVQGTGGVSVFGAQLAKHMGARVIMTTSSVEKAKQLSEKIGIDHFLDYRDIEWPEAVKKLTGRAGVDVVLEVAGGESLGQSLKACGIGARVSVVGLLQGVESTISILDLLYHQISLRGILMESTQELHAFARALEANRIIPYVDRVFPFQEARQAYEYMAAQKHVGKVVIELKKG